MTDQTPVDNTPDRMTATWTGGRGFVCRSASGHEVMINTPVASGGDGSAPSPMELVLLGLVGCTGIDVSSILERMREPLKGLEVAATYERSENHPRVYTKIHLTYTLQGDLDEKKVQRAIDLSESTYCSVSAMLSPAVEISHEYVIES